MDGGERLLVNKGELARILKCSLPTLNALIERWPDFPVETRGSNGVEWEFDVQKVLAFLQAKKDGAARDSDQRRALFEQFTLPIDVIVPDEAKDLTPGEREKLARARTAERKLALESGHLLLTTDVRQVLAVALARLGRFMDTLPTQVARKHNLPDDTARSMRAMIEEQRRVFVRDLRDVLLEEEPARNGTTG